MTDLAALPNTQAINTASGTGTIDNMVIGGISPQEGHFTKLTTTIPIASSFDMLTSGTNSTATMVVDTGASLFATGSGSIEATTTASQTGTGSTYVANTSPTLITPNIGVALADNVNKVSITEPATGSTLTIEDGFTLTADGNATVSGTNTGDQTNISGNAESATALQTPRDIYGNSFDGTEDLDETIAQEFGGTGYNSYADGELLIGNSKDGTLAKATLIQGSNITITNGNGTIEIAASGSIGTGFNDISSGTNTTAAMVIGSGASLSVTGGGTIAATSFVGINTPDKGGTGIANNSASTITISGNFGTTFTITGSTNVTFPTSGTLTTLATVVGTANNFTKTQSSTPVAITSTSNHIATDASLSNIFTHTLTENTTLDNPTNLVSGTYYTWYIVQASSAKTLAYGNKFKWPNGTAMVVSTGNGAIDIITSLYDGTNLNSVFSQSFS